MMLAVRASEKKNMPTRAKKVKRKQRARTRKRTPGRPTKYNSKIAKTIFKHVSEGVSREGSASLAGINPDTLYDWQRKYPEFSDGLQRADAKFERAAIRSISRAGKRPRHWTASAWSLERKFPNRYGKIDRHVIGSKAMQVAPTAEYIKAVNLALGIGPGLFKPLHDRSEAEKKADEALPTSSKLLPENVSSFDDLPILP
jgi:hypothetical protein